MMETFPESRARRVERKAVRGNRMKSILLLSSIVSLLIVGPSPPAILAEELVVYSARKEELIRPVIEAFQKEAGIKITLLTGKAGELARRIEVEKGNPKGDLFIGTSAGITELLRRKGLLVPISSSRTNAVPEEFRAPDKTWVGITGRVRVLIYNRDRAKPQELPRSILDLTNPKWKGKVAVASSGERTTVSWIAAIMALKGEAFTRDYIQGLLDNGLKVLNNNTEVRRAVARGEYAIGITNHYYYLIQLNEDPKSPVGILYPDQGSNEMGTPVFSITAAILKGAKHPKAAQAFVDYLLRPEGNRLLVEGEYEIPLLPKIPLIGGEKGVKGLGQFTQAPVTQVQMADLEPMVERLFGTVLIP